jgi:hypothetical protein
MNCRICTYHPALGGDALDPSVCTLCESFPPQPPDPLTCRVCDKVEDLCLEAADKVMSRDLLTIIQRIHAAVEVR